MAREVEAWRARAALIPDAAIRQDALTALACKRANVDGAALFWTLPHTRRPALMRLLASYQIMWDFLDCASERGAGAGQRNGRQLHIALRDALGPGSPISSHYRHHPWKDDGRYLRALVESCRACYALLPSHRCVMRLLSREALRANIQAINHDLDPCTREAGLRGWCAREFPNGQEASWFEVAGAAGAGISIYALLALAAETRCSEAEIERIYNAYFPWASAVATMLDSYVDHVEDIANGDHVYIAYYPTLSHAIDGMGQLVRRTFAEVGALPGGERHMVIVACMVAMYLSKNTANSATVRAASLQLRSAGGSMTRMLHPILRLWRAIYNQSGA